jgi:hypothetical protein
MAMNSFILPNTPARELISRIGSHFLIEDRKAFHRPIEEVETCHHCGKPLGKVMDEINGIELVCNNCYCPGK